MFNTEGPKVNCVVQVDFCIKGRSPPCGDVTLFDGDKKRIVSKLVTCALVRLSLRLRKTQSLFFSNVLRFVFFFRSVDPCSHIPLRTRGLLSTDSHTHDGVSKVFVDSHRMESKWGWAPRTLKSPVPVRYDACRKYRECAKSLPSPLPSPAWSETFDAASPVKCATGDACSASSKPLPRRDFGHPSTQSWAERDGFRLWDGDDEDGGGTSGKDAPATPASSPVVSRTSVAGIVYGSGDFPDRQNQKGPGAGRGVSSSKLHWRPHRHRPKSPIRSLSPVRRRGATAPCTSQSPAHKSPPFRRIRHSPLAMHSPLPETFTSPDPPPISPKLHSPFSRRGSANTERTFSMEELQLMEGLCLDAGRLQRTASAVPPTRDAERLQLASSNADRPHDVERPHFAAGRIQRATSGDDRLQRAASNDDQVSASVLQFIRRL